MLKLLQVWHGSSEEGGVKAFKQLSLAMQELYPELTQRTKVYELLQQIIPTTGSEIPSYQQKNGLKPEFLRGVVTASKEYHKKDVLPSLSGGLSTGGLHATTSEVKAPAPLLNGNSQVPVEAVAPLSNGKGNAEQLIIPTPTVTNNGNGHQPVTTVAIEKTNQQQPSSDLPTSVPVEDLSLEELIPYIERWEAAGELVNNKVQNVDGVSSLNEYIDSLSEPEVEAFLKKESLKMLRQLIIQLLHNYR
jgi:hypothetical protein